MEGAYNHPVDEILERSFRIEGKDGDEDGLDVVGEDGGRCQRAVNEPV